MNPLSQVGAVEYVTKCKKGKKKLVLKDSCTKIRTTNKVNGVIPSKHLQNKLNNPYKPRKQNLSNEQGVKQISSDGFSSSEKGSSSQVQSSNDKDAFKVNQRNPGSGINKNIKCPKCSKLISKSNLVRHQRTKICYKNQTNTENQTSDGLAKRNCDKCGKLITSTNLARHKRSKNCIPTVDHPKPETPRKIENCWTPTVAKKTVSTHKLKMNNVASKGNIGKPVEIKSLGISLQPLSPDIPLPVNPKTSSLCVSPYIPLPSLISPLPMTPMNSPTPVSPYNELSSPDIPLAVTPKTSPLRGSPYIPLPSLISPLPMTPMNSPTPVSPYNELSSPNIQPVTLKSSPTFTSPYSQSPSTVRELEERRLNSELHTPKLILRPGPISGEQLNIKDNQLSLNLSKQRACWRCGKNITISNMARHQKSKNCQPQVVNANPVKHIFLGNKIKPKNKTLYKPKIKVNNLKNLGRSPQINEPRSEHSTTTTKREQTKVDLTNLVIKYPKAAKKTVNITKSTLNNVSSEGMIRKPIKLQRLRIRPVPLSVTPYSHSTSPIMQLGTVNSILGPDETGSFIQPPQRVDLPDINNNESVLGSNIPRTRHPDSKNEALVNPGVYFQLPEGSEIPDSNKIKSILVSDLHEVYFQPPQESEHRYSNKIKLILGSDLPGVFFQPPQKSMHSESDKVRSILGRNPFEGHPENIQTSKRVYHSPLLFQPPTSQSSPMKSHESQCTLTIVAHCFANDASWDVIECLKKEDDSLYDTCVL